MGWSFRKRVKIIPGIHLNIGKGGISASVGMKGANFTFSKKGTFFNASIPNTGFSYRTKLGGADKNSNDTFENRPFDSYPNSNEYSFIDFEDNIFSADVSNLTSQSMQYVKNTILQAREQRISLTKDIKNILKTHRITKCKLWGSYLTGLCLVKKIKQNLKSDINVQKLVLKELNTQLESNSSVNLEMDFSNNSDQRYEFLKNSFNELIQSNKIWDVTASYATNSLFSKKKVMGGATESISRKEVRFHWGILPEISKSFEALVLNNANGADLYIYPAFVIMLKNQDEFAIIDINEIQFSYEDIRFIENEKTPKDSEIIDYTWQWVNKNGQPDRRYKNNTKIPIIGYGGIVIKTMNGVNEEYMISNKNNTKRFVEAFEKYKSFISE